MKQSRPDSLAGNFGKEKSPPVFGGRLLKLPVALFLHPPPPMTRNPGLPFIASFTPKEYPGLPPTPPVTRAR